MAINLTITSDDFGMSYGINQGVHQAATQHLITCTNYMVPTPWFEHAVNLALPLDIDFGVHLTLTNEWNFYKWKPLTSAKSLVDEFGYLKSNIHDLMHKAIMNEIKEECYAQIDVATKKDPRVMFIDLHMCIPTFERNSIVNPPHEFKLLEIISDISKETGLIYPYAIKDNKRLYFDSHISISGKTQDELLDYLNNINSGNHHLSCHCSINSEEQSHFTNKNESSHPWALEYRLLDMQMLNSRWFNEAIINNGINKISLSKLFL
jgi:hypothetical protein